MMPTVQEEGHLIWRGRAARTGRRAALVAGALLAMPLSSCTSNPVPRPTARPVATTLVGVGPIGYSYVLSWKEPVAQLTDGSNTFKVVGAGIITIGRVNTVIEPASTPVVVEWSGIEEVTGSLNDARTTSSGYGPGATGIALRGTLPPAPGASLHAGVFYNLVILLQTTERFSQPWTIVGTDVTYRVGNGPPRTLRVSEQVQVA